MVVSQVHVQQGPKVTEGTPVFKDHAQGQETLPVGVWSEETELKVGCKIDFATPPGVKIQYRYYNRKWKDWEAGSSPNASHLRWMATEDGVTEAPYTVQCPR
jgi:hypothetical protein